MHDLDRKISRTDDKNRFWQFSETTFEILISKERDSEDKGSQIDILVTVCFESISETN